MTAEVDVAIVGGGPVGLYLGARLARGGLSVRVLEKRAGPSANSRAIGIHPPALALMARLGIAEAMQAAGVEIRRGRAYAGRRLLGTLDFGCCPPPYRFVLALPQPVTEGLLGGALQRAGGNVQRSAEVTGVIDEGDAVRVRYTRGGGEDELRARFAVGCDGKRSLVRAAMGARFVGGPYPDTYLMGDFTDDTALGSDAAIYLTREGLVESFPLPGGQRRWVVKTERLMPEATAGELAEMASARVGLGPFAETNAMLSAFGVARYLASRLVGGRLALAGDAAHIVSPIGGQGMNLGWLGAERLAGALERGLHGGEPLAPLLAGYERQQARAARRVMRQAAFNTLMGRKSALAPLRDVLLWGALHSPAARLLAYRFTMQGV
jgi:2-polyprenyl-6-methoxyphenol hydroxylase-like FAD-dependent oxidoreductase